MSDKTEREVLLEAAAALRIEPWADFDVEGARDWFDVGRETASNMFEIWRYVGASCAESAAWSAR